MASLSLTPETYCSPNDEIWRNHRIFNSVSYPVIQTMLESREIWKSQTRVLVKSQRKASIELFCAFLFTRTNYFFPSHTSDDDSGKTGSEMTDEMDPPSGIHLLWKGLAMAQSQKLIEMGNEILADFGERFGRALHTISFKELSRDESIVVLSSVCGISYEVARVVFNHWTTNVKKASLHPIWNDKVLSADMAEVLAEIYGSFMKERVYAKNPTINQFISMQFGLIKNYFLTCAANKSVA